MCEFVFFLYINQTLHTLYILWYSTQDIVTEYIIQIVQPFRCLRLAMIMCKAKNVGHITNVSQLVLLSDDSLQGECLKNEFRC